MFLKTSKLPRVELVKPKSAIGDSTAESIQSGIFYGYVGLVRELITRIKHELGEPATVVATGSCVSLVAGEIVCSTRRRTPYSRGPQGSCYGTMNPLSGFA
ncbi:MAG: type III pantothenate kinase [Acidobacteria bacterium]|nr:type III pantothenate kinase [Acidobacteriota bacterium]